MRHNTRIEYQRYYPVRELRAEQGEDGARVLVGYAVVFNSDSEPIGGSFIERIAPTAFAKTLREGDPVALWQHDMAKPIGRRSNNTLVLIEDEHGLLVRISLPDTSWGVDAWKSIERGDVRQMSFGFDVIKDSWEDRANALPLRVVQEARLFEVSPVTFPAYPATEVEARSVMERAHGSEPPSRVGHSETVDEDAGRGVALLRRELDLIELEG